MGRPPAVTRYDREPTREDLLWNMLLMANAKARDNFADFVRLAWPVLNEGRPLIWNWHMDAIAEHLEAITRGEIRNLLINVPPGHSKTTLVTICWPCWEWINHPGYRYICASYSDDLSKKASNHRRDLLRSSWYRSAFDPNWNIDRRDTQREIENDRGGFMLATSVGGQGTGRHGDRNIVDDPMKAEDIYTIELENHVRWFNQTLRSRVTDVQKSAFVIVMQRLHQLDLTGVLKDDPAWCLLKIPAEFEPAKRYFNTHGWTDLRTEEGEALFPARFPKEHLEHERGPFGLGPVAYASQQQQDPVAGSGNIFQRHWWKFWTNETLPPDADLMIGSWDMTFKKGISADFVVGQVWARKGGNFYLLDQTRARLSFTETQAAFEALASKWPKVTRWLVEEKANGAAIIEVLRERIPGIIPIQPTEPKEARAAAISSYVQAGNVYLPQPSSHPWVLQLIEEAAAFPLGSFDDQIDAMSQALRDLGSRDLDFTLPEPIARSVKAPTQMDILRGLTADGRFEAFERINRKIQRQWRRRQFDPGLKSATDDGLPKE